MINVAILGYGIVGSGVAQVLFENRKQIEAKAGGQVGLKRVLDLRDFPKSPVEGILTKDFNDILNDTDIHIVVETMGGGEPAHSFVSQARRAGKHVCTSNKELVVNHGAELLALAKAHNVSFLFEASVGGGIPVIRPINMSLTADEIISVSGILNGTTNYILTHMSLFNADFADALKEAQLKGFAEKDPSADIDGYDACRKLAILLSLCTGMNTDYRQIHTEGISTLTEADFAFARRFGYMIKLIADGRVTPDGVEAVVAPMLVHHTHMFYSVHDVFNCVQVQARMNDRVIFHGKGAGMLPTAAAVVSDIVDICRNFNGHIPHNWSDVHANVLPPGGYVKKKLARINYSDAEKTKALLESVWGGQPVYTYQLPDYPKQMAFMIDGETETESAEKLKEFDVLSLLRVYESGEPK
jgi:homoserine dehydrogenase